jgi:hypothetical protein
MMVQKNYFLIQTRVYRDPCNPCVLSYYLLLCEQVIFQPTEHGFQNQHVSSNTIQNSGYPMRRSDARALLLGGSCILPVVIRSEMLEHMKRLRRQDRMRLFLDL